MCLIRRVPGTICKWLIILSNYDCWPNGASWNHRRRLVRMSCRICFTRARLWRDYIRAQQPVVLGRISLEPVSTAPRISLRAILEHANRDYPRFPSSLFFIGSLARLIRQMRQRYPDLTSFVKENFYAVADKALLDMGTVIQIMDASGEC